MADRALIEAAEAAAEEPRRQAASWLDVKRYRTIVVDPPWRYTVKTAFQNGNPDRRGAPAESRYGTMTNSEIRDLPVADLAPNQAHLYLWVTNPRLYRGRGGEPISPLDIAEAWGFTYVTLLTWVKTGAPGLGFYFRGMTEHCLFATRNKCPIGASVRESNVITAPRTRHSAKPDCFYDLVERVSPGPYLELFARRARFGWDYWGDESLKTTEMEMMG